MSRRIPWQQLASTAAIGLAGLAWAVRYAPAETGHAGAWQLACDVICEPRLIGPIVMTLALIRSILRPALLPAQLLRLGTWRAALAHEALLALRSASVPAAAVLALTAAVGIAHGLSWTSTTAVDGSAAGILEQSHLPAPVGILAQLLLVTATTVTVHLVVTSVRLATGHLPAAVAVAAALWGWLMSGTATVTITASAAAAGTAPALAWQPNGGAGALDNYLDLPGALSAGCLPAVLAILAAAAVASVSAVALMDWRIRRRRSSAAPAVLPVLSMADAA